MSEDNIILRTYKFRIKPTKLQEELLNKHFGCTRFVYNYFLSERIKQYKDTGKSDNSIAQMKYLTILKRDLTWLKEVNSQALQEALKNLQAAYKNFFTQKHNGFPKFKSKKSRNSFTVPQHAKLEYGRLRFPKFNEGIKVIVHRPIKGEVGRFTLSKTKTGKYFVSILTKEDYKPRNRTKKFVGCDFGIKELVITSDNKRYENHRYTKKYEKKLARAQRHLSKKKKGSNSFERQRRKVSLIHEKIANARNDHQHKVTTELISNYDIIAIEDLGVKGMIKNKKLSKHIADASFGTIRRLIEYKAKWNNKLVILVDKFFPSSKNCSICGRKKSNLTLQDRVFVCDNGHVMCRDLNAARNIIAEGLRKLKEILNLIGAGLSDHTGGEGVSSGSNSVQLSVKLEANTISL